MCYESLSVGKKGKVGVGEKSSLPRQNIGTDVGNIRTIDYVPMSPSAVT